jgi:hypothetical protein
MKLISLWQPWATAMALNVKCNETRSWRTSYRGWLAIQASKGGLSKTELRELCRHPEFMKALGWEHSMLPLSALCETLPFGQIIAVVKLTDCVPMDLCGECDGCGWSEGGSALQTLCRNCAGGGIVPRGHSLSERERAFGSYEIGRFAWITEDCFRLPKPIPFRAKQGMNDLSDDVVNQIREQWKAVRVA